MNFDNNLWNKALELEKKLLDNGEAVSWTKISNELGLPERQSRYIWFALKNKDIISPMPINEKPDQKNIHKDFGEEEGTVTTKSLNIQTVEDAIKVSNLDLNKWEIYRHNINTWEVTIGGNKTHSGLPETYTNFQVKLWVRKRIPEVKETALNNIIDRLNKNEILNTKRYNYKKSNDELMAVMGLSDIHFGLLAHKAINGEDDYNLKISENIYVNAVEDSINRIGNFGISKIVIPLGNDFFHVNNTIAKTPKGNNMLDTCDILTKIFEAGEMAVIKSIERCLQVAPVDILWVPGNHDPETSYFLCKLIKAYYRNNENVNVDVSTLERKFLKWGTNLIGFAHGQDEKIVRLPHLMVDACPEWASICKNKEWLTGHFHKKKETNFIGIDTIGSTTIRVMPSLCSADQWHYRKGFIGSRKSMETYVYNQNGLMAYFPVLRRD